MRLILANLFIFGFLWLLYYLNAFALFDNKYMSWFAPLLVISIFVIAFKIIGSPFHMYDDDDNDNNEKEEKQNEDYEDDNNTSRKRKMKNKEDE